MRLSAKAQYACIAALELARHYATGELVQIRQIAAAHNIPSRFLVQILLQLKNAGWINSTRGAAGGYRLSHPPGEITLGAIIEVVEGPPEQASGTASASSLADTILLVCQQVTRAEKEILDNMTLSDLLERAEEREPMYYI